ncbi:hypothetical protein [Legionella drozanskii]|uniref:Uncharacterized protein n=1 Tax=Legionella drozanskii LLAP-1 TaxID=1212489 RepID=A0A0W0SWA4_9GAMM|nr:hypothetical protein [Legionella drozanskii]KTC87662.1 hypothetical protein Ldro_1281 [Legionella drozanskii LLAP-1]
MKTIILALGLVSAALANAAPLKLNQDAIGKPALHFIQQIDEAMPPYIRALSFQKPTEFKALQFAALLNQSANIEKKLDLLIEEIRETNRLLKR